MFQHQSRLLVGSLARWVAREAAKSYLLEARQRLRWRFWSVSQHNSRQQTGTLGAGSDRALRRWPHSSTKQIYRGLSLHPGDKGDKSLFGDSGESTAARLICVWNRGVGDARVQFIMPQKCHCHLPHVLAWIFYEHVVSVLFVNDWSFATLLAATANLFVWIKVLLLFVIEWTTW